MRWAKIEGLHDTPSGTVLVVTDGDDKFQCPVEQVPSAEDIFAQECKRVIQLKFPAPDAARFIEHVHDWSVYQDAEGQVNRFDLLADVRGYLGRQS